MEGLPEKAKRAAEAVAGVLKNVQGQMEVAGARLQVGVCCAVPCVLWNTAVGRHRPHHKDWVRLNAIVIVGGDMALALSPRAPAALRWLCCAPAPLRTLMFH